MSHPYLLTIDPGVHALGAALFVPDTTDGGMCLRAAEYLKFEKITDIASTLDQFVYRHLNWPLDHDKLAVVIEKPRIYPHGAQRKGDLNDLLDLAEVVGACGASFTHTRTVYPRDWKGTVKKEVMTARIEDRLRGFEQLRVTRVGAKDHNTLDAVGIGLHVLGRLAPKRVIHR